MTQYWHISNDVDIKQDYLFYTQFNIMLPYYADKLGFKPAEYLNWLDNDFDLDHAMRMAPIWGLHFCKRFSDAEELIVSPISFLNIISSDEQPILPIQVYFISNKVDIADATMFADSMLDELSNYGDNLAEGELDQLLIFRIDGTHDLFVYFGMTASVLLLPSKVTEQLQKHSAFLTCPNTVLKQTDTLKSDVPLIWAPLLRRIKQTVSRRLDPTKLIYEIAGWTNRQLTTKD
ncbi:hypothetical protein [Photobacterium sp. GB-72]|uniref:hypothetical protein n=1 Tax=Photobacterium sp. GB-72 TaxID=2022105 RepID=UPI000D16706A|nr:hypothetical protein [Photobacterium sp. GB-72]PSV28091.1 hypothetical protein C9J40_19620 [Photobacterium sp. GB-72]